ncbi:MAG TPA: SDR family NAD(P)-dependent oxidoreductase [Galbitalea sp.]|jgi:L-rhamnose 1-dehydrogenase|nr:SDR family NAD(P)-dependent oxidoreductase [Galbitalea sp.]
MSARTAVITGSSRGIGLAIARRLASEACAVHLLADAAEEVEAAAAALRAEGFVAEAHPVDVSDSTAVKTVMDDIANSTGALDVVVAAAGICPLVPFDELTVETWDRTVAVNLSGTFYTVFEGAKHMIEFGRGGAIVAVSSISAHVGGRFQVHYTPTKAGQVSLMQSLAVSLAPHGIRCNSVLPGTIDTALNANFLADPVRRGIYEKGIPLGRIGNPGDVAGAVAFLSSVDAAYITGAEILVDGGALAGLGG